MKIEFTGQGGGGGGGATITNTAQIRTFQGEGKIESATAIGNIWLPKRGNDPDISLIQSITHLSTTISIGTLLGFSRPLFDKVSLALGMPTTAQIMFWCDDAEDNVFTFVLIEIDMSNSVSNPISGLAITSMTDILTVSGSDSLMSPNEVTLPTATLNENSRYYIGIKANMKILDSSFGFGFSVQASGQVITSS